MSGMRRGCWNSYDRQHSLLLVGFSVFLFTLTDKASGREGGGFVIGVLRNTRVRHRRRTEYD